MICPKCKKTIKDNAKFCGYCGKKFQSKPMVASAPVILAPIPTPKPVAFPAPSPQPVTPQQNAARCPKCGSTSLQARNKGVSVGKAAAGALLIGPLGLLAGGIGMNDAKVVCLNCGHSWTPYSRM